MPKPILLYTSFGIGPHVDEVLFSASSAAFERRRGDDFRIVIFTDDPKPFQSADAEVVTIEPAVIDSWKGPNNYIYRLKINAVREALLRFNVPVAMIDGDTYFLKSPQKLFDRIAAGRSLMHLPEGRIGYLAALGHVRHQLGEVRVKTADDEFHLHGEWLMWNSGVVGIHPADIRCTDRILDLSDAILQATSHKNAEQFSFSEILAKSTDLRSCRDILFHYHQAFIRDPFRARLHGLLEQAAALPADQQPGWLYQHRPRSPAGKKIKAMFKRPLKRFGFFKSDLNTSI